MSRDGPLRRRIAGLVARIILESTGREVDVEAEESLIGAGVLDSMSMVSLVIALQEEFAVQLDVTDMSAANFDSVRAITGLVEARGGR